MSHQWECMCLTCGISVHLSLDGAVFDDPGAGTLQTIMNIFCPECGGQMGVVGKAGDQPFYTVC